MDTFITLWNRVQLRVPAAGPDLCQDLIRDAFQQLKERRMWSWLFGTSTFYPPTFTVTGTISVTAGSTIVTGVGSNFSANMVGMQFRVGNIGGSAYPTYTIIQYVSPTSVMLDRVWTGATLSAQPYVVFQCYFTVPSDFNYFYSVVNSTANYRLNHNATEAEFDAFDPQRAQSGLASALAFYDYTQNYAGLVAPVIQIKGSGPSPVSTSALGFSYPQDSIYSVEIAGSGAVGVATFNWKQDNGITSGTSVLTSGSPQDLSNGVQVYFPVGTYVAGNMFVFFCKADTTTGVPRYEMWPRPIGASYAYPYLYVKRIPPLSDEQPQLPKYIADRGDVLVEMALTNLALWPGTNNQPNPYRDPMVSNMHRNTAEKMIYELEKKDDDVGLRDLTWANLPYTGPWQDGSWLQQHAVYY